MNNENHSAPPKELSPEKDFAASSGESEKWEKTHPLSENQNRILTGAIVITLLILAVALYFGFSEMFKTQGF